MWWMVHIKSIQSLFKSYECINTHPKMVLIKYRIFVHSIESIFMMYRQYVRVFTWISALFLMSMTTLHGTIYPTLLGENNKITIPFTNINGFIVVDVVIQNIFIQKMILDTGAEHTILFPNQSIQLLRLPVHKKIKVQGADLKSEIIASVSNGALLSIVNTATVRTNLILLEDKSFDFSQYLGIEISGIVGMELFKSMILHIDYKNNTITLHDSESFNPKLIKNHHAESIKIVDNKPYITSTVSINPSDQSKVMLLLDTGAGMTAMLHNNTDSTLTLPAVVVSGNIGKGISGDVEGFSGKVLRLKFGALEFQNLIVHFQALDSMFINSKKFIRNGIIGNQILSRLDIYIDFMHDVCYIKPLKGYDKHFEMDKSGMTVFSFGANLNQYYVKYVLKDSPADKADIRVGDVIKKMGFWNSRFLTLKNISKKLSGKAGDEIHLTIDRHGQKIKKVIRLRDLL